MTPRTLNCGLSVAPWFFTKAMSPVVAFLRKLGHRVFAYMDDFFGATKPGGVGIATGEYDTESLGRFMGLLFEKLGLTLKSEKCDFTGKKLLEILDILVDTEKEMFLLPPSKGGWIEGRARKLLRHAASHRLFVRCKELQKFAGLENSSSPALADCWLRLRELFDDMSGLKSTTADNRSLGEEPRRKFSGLERKDIRMSHAGLRDLQWWAKITRNYG